MEDKHIKQLEEFEHLVGFLKRKYIAIKDTTPRTASDLLLICLKNYLNLSTELCNDNGDFKQLFYDACDEFEKIPKHLPKEEADKEVMNTASTTQKQSNTLTQDEVSALCFREDCTSCIHNLYGIFPCTRINNREVQDYLAAKGKYSDLKKSCPEWYDEW